MPKKKGTHQIPESYLEEHDVDTLPDGFQAAFDHSKNYGNNDKASLLYAETHNQEHTGAPEKAEKE
jgi:hypothetical protein